MRVTVLSVRQPWASLIVWGLKTVELRSWTTPFRGQLFIQAAKAVDEAAMRRFGNQDLPVGAIVGSVSVTTIEPLTPVRWAELAEWHLDAGQHQPGCFAWHFANPRPLDPPIVCRGNRGLFVMDIPCDPTSSSDRTP